MPRTELTECPKINLNGEPEVNPGSLIYTRKKTDSNRKVFELPR
jgi:hypothetical protein